MNYVKYKNSKIHNVIEWYIRDAFLYRLLNRALRTRDISTAIALDFAGNGTGRPLIESVLFEIECPVKSSRKPYTRIQLFKNRK